MQECRETVDALSSGLQLCGDCSGDKFSVQNKLARAKVCTVQYSTVQDGAVQCSAVQCSAVQCSAVQCSAVQCSAEQSMRTFGLIVIKMYWKGFSVGINL